MWEFLHYPRTIDTFHEVSSEHKHALYQALDQCNLIEKFVQPQRSGENRSVMDGIISRLQSLSMQNMSLGEKQILSVARYLLRVFQRPLGSKTIDVVGYRFTLLFFLSSSSFVVFVVLVDSCYWMKSQVL